MRISDWSSDVCSSDLLNFHNGAVKSDNENRTPRQIVPRVYAEGSPLPDQLKVGRSFPLSAPPMLFSRSATRPILAFCDPLTKMQSPSRSEEHTSELQSLMRISYAVFCLKKKNRYNTIYIP